MQEIIWSKYWSYRLLVKCRRNYVIDKDEKDRDREKIGKRRDIEKENERVKRRGIESRQREINNIFLKDASG